MDDYEDSKVKSQAELRVELLLQKKITREQYGYWLRAETQDSEDCLLKKNTLPYHLCGSPERR